MFPEVIHLLPWISKGQLRSDILNFDLDTFVAAVIRYYYNLGESIVDLYQTPAVWTFNIWLEILTAAVRYIINENLSSLYLIA